MRIALFTDTYPPFINGVSTSCYNLVQSLRARGHRVLVLTPNSKDAKDIILKDDDLYIPGIELKKLYGYRVTTLYSKKILNIVRAFKPDIIHNQTDSTVGQFSKICAKDLNVPIVYTYHTAYEDYTYYVMHGFFDRFAKYVIRNYTVSVGDSSTEFITPSYKTKEYMRLSGSDIHVNVIPTGIDFSLFNEDRIDHEKMETFKKDHNITDSSKIILILGRIAKEKSIDVSIRGFQKLIEKHPNEGYRVLIVGGGPQKNELEQLVTDLNLNDYVEFLGPVPASEVPFYYHLADVYTSASLTETQGLTFMEAMAAKNIVVARYDDNLSGTIVDGYTGFFFTDEYSFVSKIERIFSLSPIEKKEILDNASKVVDVYSIEKFYSNIMEVYERAIKKFW